MNLVKSKQRVADHGEVFTPPWLVSAMLDHVKAESERIDSRFLEPACGSGNFLVQVLQRKLAAVELRYGKNEFEKRHFALFALMCIYGVELLPDNAAECRENLRALLLDYLGAEEADPMYAAAAHVLALNIVQGDARTMRTPAGLPITFAEWSYRLGKFKRRDFRLDVLAGASKFREEGSLFADAGQHELFTAVREYPPMNLAELAAAACP